MSRTDETMAKIETGDPAFPISYRETAPDGRSGMTLRDWLACQALAGMLARSRNGHGYRPRNPEQHWHEAITEEAYQLADAMLRARAASKEG